MVRMRSLGWCSGNWFVGKLFALAVCLVLAFGAQSAAAPARYPHLGEKWTNGFRLEPGATYTYVLSSGDRNRPFSRFEERGRLNLWVAPGATGEIRFWYTLDGVHKSGVAPTDPHGFAGAVLLSALAGPDPLSLDALRLLATPFQWVQWADLFLESSFRNGVVWEVYQHPPLRFTANRRGHETYEGEVTLGRDTLLEMRLKLSEPLPERLVSRYARDVYLAEIEKAPPRRVLR